MTTVGEHLRSTDEVICRNIGLLVGQRSLLSQNILSQLRNLVEGVAVRLQVGSSDAEFKYSEIEPAMLYVKGKAKFNFLGKFHRLLQISSSHYTVDGDSSERLMLKYYEYLHRIRTLLQEGCGIAVLANLELFPVDLDPSLREYQEKIAERIESARAVKTSDERRDRYYIHKKRPFFVGGRIYYEVTFYQAVNKVSKFDRIIAFTHIDMTDKYSANLTIRGGNIEVLDRTLPIMIIRDWEVSIRPCEFDNFGRLLGFTTRVRTDSAEYRYLMQRLTAAGMSLLDLIDLPDNQYELERRQGTTLVKNPYIFPVIDVARRIVQSDGPGHNVIRYLMLRMHNQILKRQYNNQGCDRLSGLKLQWGCIPFDTMPFCTSLPGHNPRYWDLIESLDTCEREHELLVRRVLNNVERNGILYTPLADLVNFGDVSGLISTYNKSIYYKHVDRRLVQDKGHVFIRGYEDETVAIVKKLQSHGLSGIDGYSLAVERWLDEVKFGIDDDIKKDALKRMFCHSRVALIYGAAGTGKSTMVDHIANYFVDSSKLFLAHTNPAIDNLKRRVSARNSEFRTISSQIYRTDTTSCDLLVIDECSTVSNSDFLRVLEKTQFRLLVLVGDVYQIESIRFGNWFSIVRRFLPRTSVFELTTPFRTKSESLLCFWNKVRNIEDDLSEVIARNGYSRVLDRSFFQAQAVDEIVLCLNYDGLYGINNVNRFLQSSNPNPAIAWRVFTYKVGDPVLFNETERFRSVIYNNLKGRIVDIHRSPERITFDIELDRPLSAFDVEGTELEYVEGSIVRFFVEDHEISDADDDSVLTTVPFQVAYAVSIHKAQGLEYDSVKIIITDANEDDITHSIFYTAITRARERLKIYWTPETQQAVLKGLFRKANPKDVHLLCSRGDLTLAPPL